MQLDLRAVAWIEGLRFLLQRRGGFSLFAVVTGLLWGCVLETRIVFAADEVPFVLPEQFEMVEAANDQQVHDAFCMCMDSLGRPVVSGPGYLRTLVDGNEDGVFEKTITHPYPPKQGAQGLWAESEGLYWVGDSGLWFSADTNQDGTADAKPTEVLNLPTGGEHDVHAFRRGPDGFWYLIAGNFAKGIDRLRNDPASPVMAPRAGTLWRISPDFKTRSVWAHGLRNAYDFDFLPNGQIVTFDSDGERDVTLPWYRPTRVMLLSAGSDAGWVGEAWRDSETRVTMPMVLADLGRGSPTGVAVYRHRAFPKKYDDAIFALDWTFGKILALYPERVQTDANDPQSMQLRLGAETFVEPRGTVGFAPTDVCVAPDGSLLVCVGGRGTRGAIYRIRYTGNERSQFPSVVGEAEIPARAMAQPTNSLQPSQRADLETLSRAPCPLETWSEDRWMVPARRLGAKFLSEVIQGNIRDEQGRSLSSSVRQAAWMALLRMEQSLPPGMLDRMMADADPVVQRLGWFTLGRTNVRATAADVQRWQQAEFKANRRASFDEWDNWLGSASVLAQLECFGLRGWRCSDVQAVASSPLAQANYLRQHSLWAQSRSATKPTPAEKNEGVSQSKYRSRLLFGEAPSRIDAPAMDELGRAVAAKQLKESIQQYLEAVTTVQAALGDPRHRVPPQLNTPSPSVLDGYRGLYFDQAPMEVRNSWAKWMMGMAKRSLQRNWPEVQVEALRGLAMLESDLPEAADYCLAQIDSKSHPTADIHALCALAQCKSKRAPAATQKTATTLLELREKVRSRGLNIDNNWQPRLAQLTNELVRADPDLASALVGHPSFGAAEHLIFTEGFSKETRELARKKFREALVALPTRNWSTGQIRFIATDKAEASWLPLVRNASQEPSLRATAIELLAKRPMQEDYGIFLKAIDSSDRSAWPSAFGGIKKLPVLDAPAELVALASLLSRLDTEASTPSRAEVVARLQLLSKDQRWSDYPKQSDWSGWKAFFQKHLDAVEFQRIAQQRVPPEVWTQQIEQASELAGEASRGSVLFNQAKCAQCHGGGSALGPDLAGISKRFSKQDLFTAIYEPNRDISDRYRAVRVLTSEDQVVVGLPIYDSADGVTLQCADGSLVRINQEDIQQKRTVAESIMPAGLLDNFSPHQLADLMAYLKSL